MKRSQAAVAGNRRLLPRRAAPFGTKRREEGETGGLKCASMKGHRPHGARHRDKTHLRDYFAFVLLVSPRFEGPIRENGEAFQGSTITRVEVGVADVPSDSRRQRGDSVVQRRPLQPLRGKGPMRMTVHVCVCDGQQQEWVNKSPVDIEANLPQWPGKKH